MKEMSKSKKLMAFLILAGSVAITSCNEQEEINPSQHIEDEGINLDSKETEAQIISQTGCIGNNDVTLNGTAQLSEAQLRAEYCPLGRLTYVMCDGGPNLSFEGFSNGFIRPLTGGWSIGTISLSEYNDSWSSMTITPEASNPGTSPTGICSSVSGAFITPPTNVVGLDGSIFVPGPGGGNSGFGQGYWNVVIPSFRPNIFRAVVVWRGSSSTDPAGATEAYAIRVDALNAIPGPDNNMDGQPDFFTSQVIFDYRKAL